MILVFTMLYFWCVKITKGTVQRNGTMEQHCEGRTTDVIREGGANFGFANKKGGGEFRPMILNLNIIV